MNPALWRLRQGDCQKSETSLNYIMSSRLSRERPSLKKINFFCGLLSVNVYLCTYTFLISYKSVVNIALLGRVRKAS